MLQVAPAVIEYDGQTVEIDRHYIRIKLPSGHNIEAQIGQMDYLKLKELLQDYRVQPALTLVQIQKCSSCKQTWEGSPDQCPACGHLRS